MEVSSENGSNFNLPLHNLSLWKQIQISSDCLDPILIPTRNPLPQLTTAIKWEKYLFSSQANEHILLTGPCAILANECLGEALPHSTLLVLLYKYLESLL